MNEADKPIEYIILDSTKQSLDKDILFPYAWDEIMCRHMQADSACLLHIWQHPLAFVLGLRDRLLPNIIKAKEWLQEEGYDVAVRNSGGAAVPLDLGVVNLSLIVPHTRQSPHFRDDFQRMVKILKQSLSSFTSEIKVGEINGSYCPGEFDLSLRGLKFCGISQRRQASGYVIQAFVNVLDLGDARAEIVSQFYEKATLPHNDLMQRQYPAVKKECMSSLNELIGIINIQAFVKCVIDSFREERMQLVEVQAEGELSLNKLNSIDLYPRDEIEQMKVKLRNRYAIDLQ